MRWRLLSPKYETVTTCYFTTSSGGGGSNGSPTLGDSYSEPRPEYVVFEFDDSEPIGTAPSNTLSVEDAWEEDQISDSQLKPCMKTILKDLKNLTQGVGQTVKMFAGNTPGYNWNVKDGTLSQGTGMTSTQYDKTTGTVTTTFDSQSWKNATELSWARTILHEAMHAYFVAYYNINRPAFLGTYQQMVQDWSTYQNWNDVHHEEFARSLVTGIADALEEYGTNKGYNLSRQFYEDMSWAGLQDTTTFQNLSSSTKQRIQNTNSVELTGVDLNGNTKTQKGTNADC